MNEYKRYSATRTSFQGEQAEIGRIHSFVRQIACRTKELDAGTVRRMEFIAGKLIEQVGPLAMQK